MFLIIERTIKNKIVIVAGDLASGKTTYSEILAKNFGIARFNKDNIKEILGEQIGFHNREENGKLSSATFRLMCHMITRFAEVHQNIILEANFHNEELEVIAKSVSRLTVVFYLCTLRLIYRSFISAICILKEVAAATLCTFRLT